MSAIALTQEMTVITGRTRKAVILSVVAHAALLGLLSLYHEIRPGPLGLAEITWLDPGEAGAAAAAPAPVIPIPRHEENGIALKEQPETRHFARENPEAAIAPDPQDPVADEDRLSERLATLQQTSKRPSPQAPLAVGLPGAFTLPGSNGAGLASVSGVGGGTGVTGLARGGGGGGGNGTVIPRPIEMKRSAERPAVPVPAVVPRAEPKRAAERQSEEPVAERTLAGATLVGPVADRKLLSFARPVYPEWAKREGVEATVRLWFVVLESGTVKENIVVQKTSGYRDFDGNAIDALRTWRFEPLRRDVVGEQWGEITFRYRLSDSVKG